MPFYYILESLNGSHLPSHVYPSTFAGQCLSTHPFLEVSRS